MLIEMHNGHQMSEIMSDDQNNGQKNGRFCMSCNGTIVFEDYNFVCSNCGLIQTSETISNMAFLNESRDIFKRKSADKICNWGPKIIGPKFTRLFNLERLNENSAEVRCFKLVDHLRTFFPITDRILEDLRYHAKKLPEWLLKGVDTDKIYYYEIILTMLGYMLKLYQKYELTTFIESLTQNFNVKFSRERYRYVFSMINHIPTLQTIFKNNPDTAIDDFYDKVEEGIVNGISNITPQMLKNLSSFLVKEIDSPKKVDSVNMKKTLVDFSLKAVKKIGYKIISNYDVNVISAVGVFIGSREILPKQYVAKLFKVCRGTISNRINDFNVKMKKVKSGSSRNNISRML